MPQNSLSNTTRRATKLTDKAQAALEDRLIRKCKHDGNRSYGDESNSHVQGKKAKGCEHPGPPICRPSSSITTILSDNESDDTTTVDNTHGAVDELTEPENELPGPDRGSAAPDDPITLEDELGALSCGLLWIQSNQSTIEKAMKDWVSPIYAFFKPVLEINMIDGRAAHTFKGTARGCRTRIRRFLDTKDARSTGNMRKHVKKCWGEDVLSAADDAKNAVNARTTIVEPFKRNGSISEAFKQKRQGAAIFSHRQHTRTETK
jgi:hypothetical protein